MSEINHPNIMHLFEFLESSNSYYLVIQYCNKGDMEDWISKQPRKYLTEQEGIYYLKQIMNGFQVLRKHRVMHRDFKLANIFLHDDTLVIGDFGFARAGFDMAQTNLGTPLTKAPELNKSQVRRAHPVELQLEG
jgi:serine/threonine-protein kinase ULK2